MKACNLASFLSSPQLTSFYFAAAFSLLAPDYGTMSAFQSLFAGIFFIAIVPLLPVVYLFLKGKTNLDVSERETRQNVYWFAIIGYLSGAMLFSYFGNKMLFAISFCYATVTFSLALVNLRWKISAHTAGITGPLTALTYVFGASILPFHLLVLPVMWLRLKMKAHTFWQVAAGSLLATMVTVVTYLLVW